MARESSLWTWLSKGRIQLRDRVRLTRVENMLGAGFPDVDGYLADEFKDRVRMSGGRAIRSGAFKLELKSAKRPARAATPIRFPTDKRDAQREFLKRAWALGESAFYLCQVGEASEARRFLLPGCYGDDLHRGMMESELAVACVDGGAMFDRRNTASEIIERAARCRD